MIVKKIINEPPKGPINIEDPIVEEIKHETAINETIISNLIFELLNLKVVLKIILL